MVGSALIELYMTCLCHYCRWLNYFTALNQIRRMTKTKLRVALELIKDLSSFDLSWVTWKAQKLPKKPATQKYCGLMECQFHKYLSRDHLPLSCCLLGSTYVYLLSGTETINQAKELHIAMAFLSCAASAGKTTMLRHRIKLRLGAFPNVS